MKINKPRDKAFLKIFIPCFKGIAFISLLIAMVSANDQDYAVNLIVPALILSIITAAIISELLLRTFHQKIITS